MFSKRSLPVLVLVLAAGIFVAFRTLGTTTPPTKYEQILHNVGELLEQVHYSPKKLDDEFSKEVFSKYMEALDPEKNIFLQSDIQELKKYENKIDDEILGGPVQFVPAAYDVFRKRLDELAKGLKTMAEMPVNFQTNETVVMDPEKLTFPKNEQERKDRWRKYVTYMMLDRYVDLLETQEKSKGKPGYVAKSNSELEKEAREKVLRTLSRRYENSKVTVNSDIAFNLFVNTITQKMDPHTDYFPPLDKMAFDYQISGHFFGIGASLRDEDGVIKIGSLLTGSPAWKSGEIQVGDIIQKVGQGNAEPVDLSGYFVEDAVKIIRGAKATVVKLTLKKPDGSTKVVTLVRDEIKDEEKFARSAIVSNGKSKIGFIYLPDFYADFDDPKGARCSQDVAKELIKLKEQKVDGVVMDLRGNGGGALIEVVQMVGLFIEDGPIVQTKDRDGRPTIMRDRDKSVLYDGPLAVLVNEMSASASEIFAAAIQDYKRGIIIGSTSTFGKGTVQRNIGLDKAAGMFSANSELGTIKLTLQKYYRINGGSVQRKGVESDVVLPDLYEHYKFREKDEADALPWDEIQRADFTTWKYGFDLSSIAGTSAARVSNNPAFGLIKTNTQWLADQNDKVYSLNIDKFRDDRKQVRETVKQLESLNKLQKELVVTALPQEVNKYSTEKDKDERFKAWLKNLSTDIYLNEAVNVVGDMVVQKNLVLNK